MADIVQRARKILADSNKCIKLSTNDTRRIILVCLLYLRTFTSEERKANNNFDNIMGWIGALYENTSKLDNALNLRQITVNKTIETLSELENDSDWKELINYSYEALEYDVDSYFSVKVNRGIRASNKKKKSFGIYYTPNDVVSFMASTCLSTLVKRKQYPSIIDCSCGSGVFLLQCLTQLENEYNTEHSLNKSLSILKQCIWGVDISGAAVDSCKMAFAQYYMEQYQGAMKSFKTIWSAIKNCFFVGDSTKLQILIKSNDSLPALYDCIIGNPPYVTMGRASNFFVGFVDNLMKFSSDLGYSALVLPLSICYSQGEGYVKLRKRIQDDQAGWTFLNYDRSPDSLFGDQVKTRNTILFRDADYKEHAIYTSTLQRWTSEKRQQLFDKIELCDISDFSISEGVPKIGGTKAEEAFRAIREGRSCLYNLVSNNGDEATSLVVNGTAYNWIYAYDHFPPSIDEKGNRYKSGTSKSYFACDERSRDFCIALLSNRFAYWYWIAVGDGFHLNTSFLTEYRIGKEDFTNEQFEKLSLLGREYSAKIKQYPTVSYNAGKTIVNYSHWEAMDIVKEIEATIMSALNLSNRFWEQIETWYDNQVRCNREE